MAKVKYGVKNGDNILGLMWDVGDGREIFVTNGNTLDLNHSLEVRGVNGEDIMDVEVLDILNEILPINK